MNLTPSKMNSITVCIIFTILTFTSADYIDDLRIDFPGAYCQRSHMRERCCENRQDNCSIPISTTLCYCDRFCKRGRGTDCCPDYKSWCEGLPVPEKIISCMHRDQHYEPGSTFMDNCNRCKCSMTGQVECENDVCLQDEDIINNVNKIQNFLGWTARNYSQFWGRKYRDGLSLRLGTLEPTYRVKSMTRLTNRVESLPVQFNSLQQWPRLISTIRDQGWCGSSWVISTSSVASDRFAIQSKGQEIVQLSPQNILSCTRRQRGCEGGHLDAAWRFIHKQGVVDEDCFPYTASTGYCKIRRPHSLRDMGCRPPSNNDRDHFYTMGPAYSINNETDIMVEIMKSGPVQATMRVYRDFFSYEGGIYRHSSASRDREHGFHSIRLVGWGEERNGYNVEKYWIAANSWGTWWGERGYFKILRGVNECLIEDYVLASWPHVFSSHGKYTRRP